MNKKLYKTGATALTITLLGSLLAACGSSGDSAGSSNTAAVVNKDGYPVVEEPITLTMMSKDTGMQNWNDMAVFDEMEKLTNIKFEFANAPMDSFDTKKNLVFASGDLPDIFYGADLKPGEEVTYGSQGVLLPLEDLIDTYAPNLKKLLDENPEIRKSITTPDGHIYTLPSINLSSIWYQGPIWYNGDFLKALKVEELPKTTEEFYTYLKRVKEEDPNGNGKADEIPLTSVKLTDIRQFLLGAWGISNMEYYADEEGKVHYTPMEEGYREYLTFMNRLWNENLLDHETFSQTDEQKKSKGKNNQIGAFSDYHPYFTLGGEPSTDDKMMYPLKSDMVDEPVYGSHPGITTGTFALSLTNPAPEASIRWVDYLYSVEGATMFASGPEGALWDYVNKETHEKKWLPLEEGVDREETRATLTPNYGIVPPGLENEEVKLGLKNDFDEWIDKENEEKLVPYARVGYPIVYLLPEEQDEVSRLLSDLKTYVEQMEAKFVTGQEPLTGWDSYLAQVKKMGGDRIAEIYQAAYDRWNQTGKKE
ncbi:extracellular solute-binding protein [Paenibacillus sp. Marseille-Q4541]|uniref:extracellular solute-binding protein n=1 Tax=Paenibacillus sp. Marseille-Q4541 TaxID=2831522 RepID=UPI001BAE4586|nr:extracellular solute-binding protein [Paenibacillus sp. Marseille-Q4541]